MMPFFKTVSLLLLTLSFFSCGPKNKTFHGAVKDCNGSDIKYYLDQGTEIDKSELGGEEPIIYAFSHCRTDKIIPLFINDKKFNNKVNGFHGNLVHYSINSGDDDITIMLIDKGVSLNEESPDGEGLPLHHAVMSGRIKTVKYILNKGVDVNIRDRYGNTPLFFCPSQEMVFVLVEKGAKIKAKNKIGQTPLHLIQFATATYKENYNDIFNIIAYYIKNGLKINEKDNNGNTPLHLCFCLDQLLTHEVNVNTVEALLKNGAAINALNNRGETPLDTAIDTGAEKDIIKFLKKHGARCNRCYNYR